MPTSYEAQLRHAAHFVNVVNAANIQHSNVNGSKKAALIWLKSELVNIQAGQRWAAEQIGDVNAALLCLLYAFWGSVLLEHYVSPSDRLKWLDPALNLVDKFPQY